MRCILPGILSLVQHNETLDANSEKFRPAHCPECGKSGLWCHGHYDRKADHENFGEDSFNPIAIPRFYCPSCHSTCSVLPECIPPQRHYPWWIQQKVFLLFLLGLSCRAISQQQKPSRWTISRWLRRLKSRFSLHGDHLCSRFPSLGRITEFIKFWSSVLCSHSLSSVMLNLNNAGVIIP